MGQDLKNSVERHLIDDFGGEKIGNDIAMSLSTTDEGRVSGLEADVSALQGQNFFEKRDLALTGLPAYTYDNGTAGVGATITMNTNGLFDDSNSDGVQIQAGDTVLIRKEYASTTNDAHQGLYDVTAVGDGSNPAVFTRSADCDQSGEVLRNKTVYIASGDTHSGHVYAIVSASVTTIGTDAIDWEEKSETPAVGAGSIDTNNLADGAVTEPKIDSGAVTATKIGTGAVTTAKLNDGAVNLAKLDTANQNRMTKVDGIEANATADQTNAEILTAWQSETGRTVSVDGAKLDGIEAGADVTDSTNVTAAGALMDSEVTNLAEVKAFASTDYATAAQGATADSAVQPGDANMIAKQDNLTAGTFISIGTGSTTGITISSNDGASSGSDLLGTSSGTYGRIDINDTSNIRIVPALVVGDVIEVTDGSSDVWKFKIGSIQGGGLTQSYIQYYSDSSYEPYLNGSRAGSPHLQDFADINNNDPSNWTITRVDGDDSIDAITGTIAEGSASKLTTAADVKTVTDAISNTVSTTTIPLSQKGANSGVAELDSSGQVPISQLPNTIMELKGSWAASTNTPTLADGTGNVGDLYIASDAGTVDFGGGDITFAANDEVYYDGAVWVRKEANTTLTDAEVLTAFEAASTRDVSADGAKLDAIETNATADQTDAEILAAWETESGRDASVDGTKLDGIEAGATADQTDAEILAAWEAETGRTVSSDGTKLDHITVTQAVDLDTIESDLANSKAVTDSMTVPAISSSATAAGSAGAAVNYTAAASGYAVLWSLTDTDTSGYTVDVVTGVFSGNNPSAGTYDVDIFALNMKTGGVSSQTVTFTIT